jgi:uncharacterized repeat protein (TIGR01451 family)
MEETTAIAGTKNTYTIVVTNGGPSTIPSAIINDSFPAGFDRLTFTASQTGGATGFSTIGTANITDTVSMPAMSRIIYKATGTISASATGSISDTASVTSDISDPNTANNSSTDSDTL